MIQGKLPVKKNKKKIDKVSFASLASKVREIFKKESEYAKKEEQRNEDNSASRLISFS